MKKIGILGGSFNPVHTGHVRMAVEVREQLGLDRVDLMPAMTPPHKPVRGMLPFALRMDLVRVAAVSAVGLGADPLESERSGPSFTCDTLTCYPASREPAEVHFIVGATTFMEMPSWERGLEIPSMVSLAVVNRWDAAEKVAGFVAEHWPTAVRESERVWRFATGSRLDLLDIPRLDIKGSHIRERWCARRDLSLLVPPGVAELLEARQDEIAPIWGVRV